MKSFLKFTLTALAVVFFVSANAIHPTDRYFASPYAYHTATLKSHNSAYGKKKHKKMKHRKSPGRGPTCYAY